MGFSSLKLVNPYINRSIIFIEKNLFSSLLVAVQCHMYQIRSPSSQLSSSPPPPPPPLLAGWGLVPAWCHMYQIASQIDGPSPAPPLSLYPIPPSLSYSCTRSDLPTPTPSLPRPPPPPSPPPHPTPGWRRAGPCVVSHVPDQIPLLPALFFPPPPPLLAGWGLVPAWCHMYQIAYQIDGPSPAPPSLPHPPSSPTPVPDQIPLPLPRLYPVPPPPPPSSPPPHPTQGWMRAGPCVVSHVPDRLSNWWSCLPSVREVMTAANTTPLHSTLDWWSQPTHTRAFLTANISNFVIWGWCLSSCVLDGHSSPESVFHERRYLQLDAPQKKQHLFILFCHAYCTNRLINPYAARG